MLDASRLLLRVIAFLGVLPITVLPGCAGRPTSIVVLVESDLAVGDVDQIYAVLGGSACIDSACSREFPITEDASFPFSFVISPSGDRSRVELGLEARAADGTVVVAQHWETDFVAGRTMLLRVRLDRACVVHACAASETCSEGACVDRRVDPSVLPDVTPGMEFRDAGPADVGAPSDVSLDVSADVLDARAVDDAAVVVTRCADLPGIAPSGPTALDPDGPGGSPAFEGWCENDADDGGWTLIAKVEPLSRRLGFDASEWTASAPSPFGTVDEAVGDALLRTYWTVPLTQLRIGNGTTWMVTDLDAPASSLRAAMDGGAVMDGGATLDATLATWSSIVAVSPVGGAPCVRSGLSLELPSASAPELRIRIGLAASNASDCGEPTQWYGLGVDVATTDASCVATTLTSGGARVCGSPGQRRSDATRLLVYGR